MIDHIGGPAPDVDIAVVMACYTEERWPSIVAALESLLDQSLQPRQVVVGVDNNRALASRLVAQFDWLSVALNDGPSGASATRNSAVRVVRSPFTAFLDDDETAEPEWLFELTRPLVDLTVVGTGGRYRDRWIVDKPQWFPDEFAWAVGGAYSGMPTVTSEVRNVWSGNMAVRTHAFRAIGGFRTDFGKRGGVSQPEDTDLCIRMSQRSGGRWMYVPTAVIDHEVPASRATLSFFVRRCFTEGSGKAMMKSNFQSNTVISTERSYVLRTSWAAVRSLTRLRREPVLQGLAMLLGLTAAALGYGAATLRTLLSTFRAGGVDQPGAGEGQVDRPACGPRHTTDGAA